MIRFRPFEESDTAACLELFDSNVGLYFAPEEREEFSLFLKLPSCVYWVMERDGKTVGCGGYYIVPETRESGLCWGMVAKSLHGKGLGMRLLLERLNRIVGHTEVNSINLDTSQHTFGFFEKLGFATEKITPNGYWPGLDRYDMRLDLNPERRTNIRLRYLACLNKSPEPT